MALSEETKANLYGLIHTEVRELIAGMLAREIIHGSFEHGIGFGDRKDEIVEEFIAGWRPMAFIMEGDGAHLVDAERAGEVACGWAMRCGMLEARVAEMEKRLAERVAP